MTDWLETTFQTTKPIIGMVHFKPLPGDPLFDDQDGMQGALQHAMSDLNALQEGGVDAVMFSNEASLPYQTSVGKETVAGMGYLIGRLRATIRVPFGVNALWDPDASLAVAKAVGAAFVREVFTGAYDSDMGVWDTDAGSTLRYRKLIDADDVRLFYNILPEFAAGIGGRDLEDVARTVVFSSLPDALCISGATAGRAVSTEAIRTVKALDLDVPVIANTGVTLENVAEKLAHADGAIVGSHFKVDGHTWNPVDQSRVEAFMEAVHGLR
jgi:membrane complex biogenesis BtpA family protein